MSDWLVIILILGAVQGLFLAAVLMSERRRSTPNRLLAATMTAFAIDLGMAVYHGSGFVEGFPVLIGADYPLAFLYGPLLYLYAGALTDPGFRMGGKRLVHLVPFALLVFALIPFYARSGDAKLAFLGAPPSDFWPGVLGVVNHLKLVHALTYLAFTLTVLRRHRLRVRDAFSYTEHVNLSWLRNLMTGIIVMAGLAVVFYVLTLEEEGPPMGLDPSSVYDDYTLLGLSLFVYAIGFMGLRQPEVFDARRSAARLPEAPVAALAEKPDEPAAATAAGPRYAKSGIDLETAKRHAGELLRVMEAEKLYRKNDLTLLDLSVALDLSAHNLTEVINTQLGKNFYDFINAYRVEEVKERLVDPSYDHLTLLALGTDAGFNSKSSFNAVFRKHTGMTPSEYRRSGRATG